MFGAEGSESESRPESDTVENVLSAKTVLPLEAAEALHFDWERKVMSSQSLSDFDKKVLMTLRSVPAGKVTTYGAIAELILGHKRGGAQAVGGALSRNPFAPDCPCHRVVKADGSLGGYSGERKNSRKRVLLQQEGVLMKDKASIDLYLVGLSAADLKDKRNVLAI